MAKARWVALRVVDDGARRLLPPDLVDDVAALSADFPTISFCTSADAAGPRTLVVVARAWEDDGLDLWRFDRLLDEFAASGPFGICVVAEEARIRRVTREVLTRAQRLLDRRNDGSSSAAFDRALALHAELHDVAKPLVRADLDHALDAWQWLLRLDPGASAAVQLAVLFHDVERLVSEANARVEHLARDYQAFKDAHASRGAEIARDVLARAELPTDVVERTASLVALHERKDPVDGEARLLADADALSFFSMNSGGYLDYFGPEQTKKKIRYTLGRLSERHFGQLSGIRLRASVRALLDGELGGESPASMRRGAE